MKNCIRPHYEKLKLLKSGFIENSNFENNRDPWNQAYWTKPNQPKQPNIIGLSSQRLRP